jgi:hypothetical protein
MKSGSYETGSRSLYCPASKKYRYHSLKINDFLCVYVFKKRGFIKVNKVWFTKPYINKTTHMLVVCD